LESLKSQDADIARIRMQPQSVEAERSVIGGILLAPESWDAIAELVDAGDFYRPEHRAIFRQIALRSGQARIDNSRSLGSLLFAWHTFH